MQCIVEKVWVGEKYRTGKKKLEVYQTLWIQTMFSDNTHPVKDWTLILCDLPLVELMGPSKAADC